MAISRCFFGLNILVASLLVAVNAQAPDGAGPVSSAAAAFLSPGSAGTDQSCSGPNPDAYCSIEQQFAQNQPPPSASYNPNDLAPAQMSQLLGALQPSQTVPLTTPTQSASISASSPETSSSTSVAPTLSDTSVESSSATGNPVSTSPAPGSTTAPSGSTISGQQGGITSGLISSSSAGSVPTATGTPLSSILSSASVGGSLSGSIATGGASSVSNTATASILGVSSSGTQVSESAPTGFPSSGSFTSLASTTSGVASLLPGLGPTVSTSLGLGISGGNTLGNGSTLSYLPVVLGTNGVLLAGSSTLPVVSSGSAPTGYAASGLPVLASIPGAPPPYPIPTGILPPGHQSPTGVVSYNGSTNSSSQNPVNVTPFLGHATSAWDLRGGWKYVTGISTAIVVFTCNFL